MKNFSWTYASVFLLATFALSGFFNADEYFQSGDLGRGFFISALSFLLFILALIYMAYRIYAEEKQKSNLRVQWGIFEYLYARDPQYSSQTQAQDKTRSSNVS